MASQSSDSASSVYLIYKNLQDIYSTATKEAIKILPKLPQQVQDGAAKAHELIKKNPNIFFFGVQLYHLWSSALFYAVGFLCGLACKVIPSMTFSNHHLEVALNDENKKQYSIAMVVSMLFLTMFVRCFISGFIAASFGAQHLLGTKMYEEPSATNETPDADTKENKNNNGLNGLEPAVMVKSSSTPAPAAVGPVIAAGLGFKLTSTPNGMQLTVGKPK